MFPLRALILGSAALTLAGCATSPASDFWNLAPIVRITDASIDGRSDTVKRGDMLAVHLETDLKPTYRWELTRLAGASVVQIGLPDYQPEAAAGVPRGGAEAHATFRFRIVQRHVQHRAPRVLPIAPYLQLVAATNMKQRTRKLTEYFHAERLNYAVAGTPNRLEYDQGFFVKYGDGAADFKPIAHLYKTQVYALAAELGVPEEIRRRPPTTDTYSLPQTQEEFYYALPYEQMDLCLWGHNHGVAAEFVAAALGLAVRQVELAYLDIEAKRRTTRYLHLSPILIEKVGERIP